MEKWTMAEELGYEPITTFWQDFTVAEAFGSKAIEETFDRVFNEYKTNYKYLTELVTVLNHKIWQLFETNKPLAEIYDSLWRIADNYACDNLKGEEIEYFYRTTD